MVACRRARPRGRGRECGERKAVAKLANRSRLSKDKQFPRPGLDRLLLLPLLGVVVIIIVSFVGGGGAAGAWRERREREEMMP